MFILQCCVKLILDYEAFKLVFSDFQNGVTDTESEEYEGYVIHNLQLQSSSEETFLFRPALSGGQCLHLVDTKRGSRYVSKSMRILLLVLMLSLFQQLDYLQVRGLLPGIYRKEIISQSLVSRQ